MSVEGVTKDNFIQYQYRSDGVKLGQKVYTNAEVTTTRDYCGRFVYENQELSYIIFSEGTIRVSKINPGDPNNPEFIAPIMTRSGTQQYGLTREFHLKDHLGNTRIVFNTSGILSENHYYPFGLPIHNLSTSTAPAGKENRYLYNGKELQDDLGLNWMDYGARFYDAGLGRWHSVDPLADLRSWVSPYNYCQNNPMNRVDPTGALDDEWDFDVVTGEKTWISDKGGDEKQYVNYKYYGKTIETSFETTKAQADEFREIMNDKSNKDSWGLVGGGSYVKAGAGAGLMVTGSSSNYSIKSQPGLQFIASESGLVFGGGFGAGFGAMLIFGPKNLRGNDLAGYSTFVSVGLASAEFEVQTSAKFSGMPTLEYVVFNIGLSVGTNSGSFGTLYTEVEARTPVPLSAGGYWNRPPESILR